MAAHTATSSSSSSSSTSNAKGKKKQSQKDIFNWTDDEVRLLLKVTNDFKVNTSFKGIDWESVRSKYADILKLFHEGYVSEEKDGFPHQPSEITQLILTTKLKNIRQKYRAAIDSGRQSGHGRVVWLFFEECGSIWGGSPATSSISSGIESADVNGEVVEVGSQSSLADASQAPSDNEDADEEESETGGSPLTLSEETIISNSKGKVDKNHKTRRALLDEKLKNFKQEKLKRKISVDSQMANYVQEDIQLKKQMLDKIEVMDRQFCDNFKSLSSNIEKLTNCITAAFSAPQYHTGMMPTAPHMHTALHMPPSPHMPTSPHMAPSPHMPPHGPHYQGMGTYHSQHQDYPSFNQQLGLDDESSQY